MGKTKPKMVLIAVIGAVAFVLVRRAVGGGSDIEEIDESDDDIDTVSTGGDAGDDEADVTTHADESDDGTGLEVRAVGRALDSFDYLAIGAAGAKAAYEEYRKRTN